MARNEESMSTTNIFTSGPQEIEETRRKTMMIFLEKFNTRKAK